MMPRWVFPLVPPVDWDSTLFFRFRQKGGKQKNYRILVHDSGSKRYLR